MANAIDACEVSDEPDAIQGRVTVSTSYDAAANLARIVVEDTGQGIAPEDVEHVFSLFVSHKGNRGTGLGLPVSDKIMKEHGGRITVNSVVGQGSRFTLELPAVKPEEVRSTVEMEMPKEG